MENHLDQRELDAIRSALRAEDFPATRDALSRSLEDLVVHDAAGTEHEARDLLAGAGRDEYDTLEQVLVDIEEHAGRAGTPASSRPSLSTSRPRGDSPLVEAGDIEHDDAADVPRGPRRPPGDE